MLNRYRFLVLVVALLSMLAPSLALDSLNVTLRGERHDFVDMGYDVVVSDGFAYVATMLTGLRVMDVSSPDTVVEVGFALFHESGYPQSRFADQVAVADDRVYVTYFNGAMDYADYRLIAYDASNPTALIQTDHIALPDYVKHVFVEGNWVYVAFGDGFPGEILGVKLIDATDPYDLQVASTFLTGENPPTGVQSRGDTLYVTTRPTLYVVNITDRSQPEIIGSFSPSGEWVYLERVQVQGNYAFLLDWSLGLRVLDISNPTAPSQVASLPLPGGFIPVVYGFKLSGTRLYYVHCEGLPDISTDVYIISVATPTAPQELGIHHLSDSCSVEGFDVENHVACCWTGDFGHEEKLYLLDLQDPDATSETFVYVPPGIPQSIARYGDRLYVPMSRDGVGIYDATDFPALSRIGWIPVAEKITVRSSSAIGDKLYLPRTAVAIDSVGIEVRDLSQNPSSPDRLAFILFPPQSGTPLMVDRHDNYLIVAGGMGGIMIFDVTDLNAASLIGQWTLWSPSNPTFSVHALALHWPIVYAPEKTWATSISWTSRILPTFGCATRSRPLVCTTWWTCPPMERFCIVPTVRTVFGCTTCPFPILRSLCTRFGVTSRLPRRSRSAVNTPT